MSAVNTKTSPRPSVLLLSEIAAAVMLLAACGGGGGGDAPQGDASAVASDAEAASSPEATPVAAAEGEQEFSLRVEAPAGSAADSPDTADDSAVLDLANDYTEDAFIATGAAQEAEAAAASTTAVAAEGEIADNVSVEPVQRESAEATTTYATPRVAALDYSQDLSSTRLALLARYKFVLFGGYKGWSTTTMTNSLASIRSRNPSIKIGHYVLNNEVPCSVPSNHLSYSLVQAVNRTNWWLRNAAGSRVQWTTAYNNCDINISSWASRNSSGQTWMQYKWAYDWNSIFRTQTNLNYVFIDAFMKQPRVTADWNRDRINDSPSLSWVQSAYRKGQASYVNSVRATTSRLKVMGNSDGDLSQAEYRELLDGAFLEGAMGKSWSLENCCGWKRSYDYYRATLVNTRGTNDVLFQTYANPTDYKMVRYGLATAMMDNGYFLYTTLTWPFQPTWFDEFSAQIGTAVDAPPTGPAQNGIYKRRYTNGIVLVNPSKTSSASIYVGAGYKRILGTQDRTVNNGARQSTVTLPPRSGLLMIRG